MRRSYAIIPVLLAVVTGTAIKAAGEPYADKAGPQAVATLEASWKDAARKEADQPREVPVLICYPKELAQAKEPAPVIVFSHGLGGTRSTYQAYGRHWASYGYVVIFPQHHGSDSAVIGHGMMEMLEGKNDLQPFLDRVADVHFVIDTLEAINVGRMEGSDYVPFKDKLDVKRIGMAGHSFGAITTQAIEGQMDAAALHGKGFADHRVTAALAMSPSGPRNALLAAAAPKVAIPAFYLTGTQDNVASTKAADRRKPFDAPSSADTYLLTLDGATHMTFVPRELIVKNDRALRYQQVIREASTAYWDAYLRGDAKARAWLQDDFAKELGSGGTFEERK